MAVGNQPGDGRTDPFGDGSGGAGETRMATGVDFTTNPQGAGTGRAAPPDFSKMSRPQQSAGPRTNAADAAPGAPTAALEANRPEAGVGSVGNAGRPFRLGGV